MARNIHITDSGFRDRLWRLRDRANLTQAELAERAGVTPKTVYNLENLSRSRFQERTLRAIADALGVTFQELVYGEATDPGAPGSGAASPERASSAPSSRRLVYVAVAMVTVIAAVLLCGIPPSSPPGVPVVVTDLTDMTGKGRWEREGRVIAEVIASQLGQEPHLRVIPVGVIGVAADGSPYPSPDSGPGCRDAVRAARSVDARWAVCGSVLDATPRLVVSVWLIDAKTSEVVESRTVTAADGETAYDLGAQIAIVLATALSGVPDDGPGSDSRLRLTPARRHYEEGIRYLYALYRNRAREELRRAIHEDSTFVMAYVMLVHPDIAPDEPERRILLAAARRHADGVTRRERLWLDAFTALWTALDRRRAIAVLEELVDAYPRESEAYRVLGRLYRNEGDAAAAIEALEKAVNVDPFDGRSFNSLAYLYASRGDFRKAMRASDRYVDLAPQQANPYDTRGDLLAMQGRYDEAVAAYEAALERHPGFFPSTQSLGCVQTVEGRFGPAERNFRALMGSADRGARTRGRWFLAMTYAYRGRLDAALDMLRNGLVADRLDGDYNDAFLRKLEAVAAIQAQCGRTAEALAAYDSLFARVSAYTHPDHWPIRYVAMLTTIDVDRAEAVCDSFSRLIEPRDGIGFVSPSCRAWVDLARGRPDAAVEALEEALAERDVFDQHYCLGIAYLDAGRAGDAVRAFEGGLTGHVSDRVANPIWAVKTYYHLGRALERAGRQKDALHSYERFLGLWSDADPVFPEIDDARARVEMLRADS